MRLVSLAVVPFALTVTTASFGAGWESGMVEDEGGPVMMAWVLATEADTSPEFRLWCGDELVLRYGPGTGGGEPSPEPVSVSLDFGSELVTLDMQYEEMDGMLAAYVEPDAPVVGLLRSQSSFAVDVPSGPWPVNEFTLAGSSKAIAAVLKTCG